MPVCFAFNCNRHHLERCGSSWALADCFIRLWGIKRREEKDELIDSDNFADTALWIIRYSIDENLWNSLKYS